MRDGEVVGIVIAPELKARIVERLKMSTATGVSLMEKYGSELKELQTALNDEVAEIDSILKELGEE